MALRSTPFIWLWLSMIFPLIQGECVSGKFGDDCFYYCNCDNCSPQYGACNGSCYDGWVKGDNLCQKRNIAYRKSVTSQGQFSTWSPTNVVDGDRDIKGGAQTCYHASSGPSDLDIHLGDVYQLYDIRVYVRDNYYFRMVNSTVSAEPNTSCYTFPETVSNPVDFLCEECSQLIQFYNPGIDVDGGYDHSLNICEVEVYECSIGTFGVNCSNFCHCMSEETCDRLSGNCSGDCKLGWNGTSCSQATCPEGKFGLTCDLSCNCDLCNSFSGQCSGTCATHWSDYQGVCQKTSLRTNTATSIGMLPFAIKAASTVDAILGTCFYGIGPTTLTIDMGKIYSIYDVTIYIEHGALDIFSINGRAYLDQNSSKTCSTLPVTVSSSVYNFICKGDSRYLSFVSTSLQRTLFICEVLIYVCGVGVFGEWCEKFCYCKYGDACHRLTGKCPYGCREGFVGKSCSENGRCPSGTFGDYCIYDCNCGGECDEDTGVCSNPCDEGYVKRSRLCQTRNIAVNKTVTSTLGNSTMDPGLAVDGRADDVRGDANCFQAMISPSNLIVDLGDIYPIFDIRIHLPIEFMPMQDGYSIANSTVYLDNNITNVCYTIPSFVAHNPYDFTCNGSHRLARTISIFYPRSSAHVFKVCELQIYDCTTRTFGEKCSMFCYCRKGTCGRHSGRCNEDCLAGWQNHDCTAKCPKDSYYGVNCRKDCKDRQCKNVNDACDRKKGACPNGCRAGYSGIDCTENCLNGTYGESCLKKCDERHCDGDDILCNSAIGRCHEGCLPGWNGTDCTAAACARGKFGLDCKYSCHCGQRCDPGTGICVGSCNKGWIKRGMLCQTENVAYKKVARTTLGMQGRQRPYYSVDGHKNDDRLCFQGQSGPSDLLIDLKKKYTISDIRIYIGNGTANRYARSSVYRHKDNVSHECYTFTENITAVQVDFQCSGQTESLTIFNPSNESDSALRICEIEIYICSLGTYGENCTEFCHCEYEPCNRRTGACPGICQSGWKGSSCSESVCPGGMFGKFCLMSCHCGNSCHPVTGVCSKACDFGWFLGGSVCQKKNIAVNKAVYSTTDNHTVFGAPFAVDGDSDIYTDYACFLSSKPQLESDWTVDLGEIYNIWDMSIYVRYTIPQSISQVTVYFDDDTMPCYTFPATVRGNVHDIPCYGYTQNITIIHPGGYQGFSICELEVYECGLGTYGEDCTEFCHCHLDACNRRTGLCPKDCRPGWKGKFCSDECEQHVSYGINCARNCSLRHCLYPLDFCGIAFGQCASGCNIGWREVDCIERCSEGTYGRDCLFKCEHRHCNGASSCNYITGKCVDGCFGNWTRIDCAICIPGVYGSECRMSCEERHCHESIFCEASTGMCQFGCTPGWVGLDCTTVCANETYGQNCSKNCINRRCASGITSCEAVNGLCVKGCQANYAGLDCAECNTLTYGLDCQHKCKDRHCAGHSECDSMNGTCAIGCKLGWNGTDCTNVYKVMDFFGTISGALLGMFAGVCCLVYQACPKKYRLFLPHASSLGSRMTMNEVN